MTAVAKEPYYDYLSANYFKSIDEIFEWVQRKIWEPVNKCSRDELASKDKQTLDLGVKSRESKNS